MTKMNRRTALLWSVIIGENDNKIFCCAGNYIGNKDSKFTDIYNINENKWIELSLINNDRYK